MAERLITVFGGSGFLGRHVVKHLAAAGARIRVAVRDPVAAEILQPIGDVGQIVPVQANLRDDDSVAAVVAGADAVVNAVGILYETRRQTFENVHVRGAARAAKAAKAAAVERFVHVSAIGADAGSRSHYARSKAGGEAAVLEAFPEAAIVRPSVVFGPEDDFFNRFAALARLMPALPLYGHGLADAGATRFQPVYVGDVAAAIVRVLADPATGGRVYELGGPKVYSFRKLMELVLKETGRRRALMPVPYVVGRLQASILQLLPNPPLTRDQLRLLEQDNVVTPGARTLADLDISPASVESVVPSYLCRFPPPWRARGPPRRRLSQAIEPHQDRRAEGDTVNDEWREAGPPQPAHHGGNGDQCGDEGEPGGDRRVETERHVAGIVDAPAAGGGGGDERRHAHQESEPGGLGTLEAEHARRCHGDAGAARARNKRQHLGQADEQSVAAGHVFDAPEGHAEPVGEQQHDAESDHRPTHHLDPAQAREGAALVAIAQEDGTGDDDRNRGDDEVAGKPRGRLGAAPDEVQKGHQHRPQIAPEIDDDGAERADMDSDVDGEALVGPASHQRHEAQVRGRTHRQEFGYPLHECN